MSIVSLPSEIIFHIVSYLDSARDVSALSLSCRAVHSASKLTLRNMRFHLVRICPDNKSIETTFQLLMEILKQPNLGQHVQEIQYYGRPDGFGDSTMMSNQKLYPRDLSDSDLDLLRNHVEKAGFSGSAAESVLEMLVQQKTGDDLGQENYLDTPGIGWKASHRGILITQALAAIFISVAPSLVSLAMTQPWKTWSSHRGYYPLEQFLLQANSNPEDKPYLRNLREVYIMADEAGLFEPGERDDNRFYIHIDFLNCFRMFDRLPSIESVGVDGITDDDQDEPIIEQGQSKMTALRINHSALSELYLARAILACKALKIFQYTIGGRGQLEPRGHINKKTFSKAILKHKNTLEVLDVDSKNYFSHYGSEDDYRDNEGPDQFLEYLEEGEDEDTIEFLRSFWETMALSRNLPS